jgi:RimJ/RimL family protein N-acetyltransferase
MLARAEEWLVAREVTRVIAPFNAAGFLGSPLTVGAFDAEPMFPLAWHPPFYERQLLAAGYRRTYPMLQYAVDFSSPRYRETKESALISPPANVRPVDPRRWRDELELLRVLFNDAFSDEWEMHPFTAAEWAETWTQLKPFAEAFGMFVADVDGEPAGFGIGFLDWTPLFRSFRGRMGPLKLLRLMRQGKRARRAGLVGIGVRESFRGRGISQSLAATLFEHFERAGFQRAIYYLVNEHNARSRGVAESFGGEAAVTHAWLDKPLAAARAATGP